MESNSVSHLKKTWKVGRVYQLLCLSVLCVAMGCADEVSVPEYIVSPHTEQTIEFFNRGRLLAHHTRLETVQMGAETHVLKHQTQPIHINPQHYTLESVPEKLAPGIVFGSLLIDSNGQSDPVVLEKILGAFGTINACILELSSLVFGAMGVNENIAHRDIQGLDLSPLEDAPTSAPKPICVLNISNLMIFNTPKSTIKWFLDRVDLTGSRIELVLSCKADFGNLEVLDGFDAAGIKWLGLYDIDNLGSLDCKLLQEGPFPDVLDLDSRSGKTPKMSEQIIRNIVGNHWKGLVVPMKMWEELMEPSEQPIQLAADSLTIFLGCESHIPTLRKGQATVNYLSIKFHDTKQTVTHQEISAVVEWASRSFGGLRIVNVETKPGAIDKTDNQFELTTTHTTVIVKVNGAVVQFCEHIHPGPDHFRIVG
ncbi:hypothetical protein NEDG_01573 [Nematocida displodere]|uniref:Uncharacterized protein n=1 Tax=Nematocida displodere TaxID=1805483 RepID=A0A177EID8_9MICR|nr:hypothetical protein NEDG_01573 [Nematocida displodere]